MVGRREEGEITAWVGLLQTYAHVVPALEADLQAGHGISLTWFDILNRLDQAPDGRLRMRELEERSVFTTSGITRLVDRVEAAGFVRRERVDDDRRGVDVVITETGRAKLAEVFPDHARSIHEHFGQFLDQSDTTAIRHATAKILGADPDLHPHHRRRTGTR